MISMGKIFIVLGFFLILLGIVILVANRFGIHLGKLPGDVYYQKGNTTIYFPIVTCILVSILLTVILWFLRK